MWPALLRWLLGTQIRQMLTWVCFHCKIGDVDLWKSPGNGQQFDSTCPWLRQWFLAELCVVVFIRPFQMSTIFLLKESERFQSRGWPRCSWLSMHDFLGYGQTYKQFYTPKRGALWESSKDLRALIHQALLSARRSTLVLGGKCNRTSVSTLLAQLALC